VAVVINEFEVIPAESRPATPEQGASDAAASRPAKDQERELERMLRRKQARALRLMAV
jgi:hypothetical protein